MNDDLLPPLPNEGPEANSNISQENKFQIANGPFGLAKGIKREEFDIAITEVQPCVFHAETLPKKHSAFQYYFLRITPVQGLAWIKAVGVNTQTNPYGYELKGTFDEMKAKLQNIYGKPELVDFMMHDSIWKDARDWMQAIQSGERRLFAQWENKSNTQLPSNLQSVFLYASAQDSYSGSIIIEYAFDNIDAANQEIAMLEDDAL